MFSSSHVTDSVKVYNSTDLSICLEFIKHFLKKCNLIFLMNCPFFVVLATTWKGILTVERSGTAALRW
jgi:hypothetical protein